MTDILDALKVIKINLSHGCKTISVHKNMDNLQPGTQLVVLPDEGTVARVTVDTQGRLHGKHQLFAQMEETFPAAMRVDIRRGKVVGLATFWDEIAFVDDDYGD